MLIKDTCVLWINYVGVFDRACGVSFIYNTNKGPRIDPWRTQFMVPASEKTVPNEGKKSLFVR